MVLYNLVLVGLVWKFGHVEPKQTEFGCGCWNIWLDEYWLQEVPYTDFVMKYFQFAIVDQKMFSISGIKFSEINLHSLSIALYTLYAWHFQSKLDGWYGLYNPTGEIDFGGIKHLTNTNCDCQMYLIYIFADTHVRSFRLMVLRLKTWHILALL